jgi:hypothetical protein
MLIKRISFEIKRRVYEPFLNHEFWWMGLNGSTNNWNIWINTNILMTALLNSDSYQRLEVINRTIVLSDNWLNSYGEDGGSAEGPAYWYESAGRFVLFYYYLSSASGHKMDFSSHQLIYNLGTYIYRVHIDQDYFFNYGDSNARLIPDPTLVYRYGQVFDNKIMRQFAAYLYRLAGKESYLSKVVLSGKLHLVFLQFDAYPKLKTIPPKAPLPSESWYPDLQLATLRTHKGSPKGLFLGVMAGNNGKSYKHVVAREHRIN